MQPGVWSFSHSAYSNFKKSPWKYDLSVSNLNPEAVIRGVPVSLQIVYHLIMIMTRKQAVYEELWMIFCLPRIAANFM